MANHIEVRKVRILQANPNGGYSERETWEYRTKDIVATVLGLIPLASSFSSWTKVEEVTVFQDQNGNVITNPLG